MSEVDTLETFNSATEWQIRYFYDNRCAFCLNKLVVEGSQCVHILDARESAPQVSMELSFWLRWPYARQVAICSELGIIPGDYERQSRENGIICKQTIGASTHQLTNILQCVPVATKDCSLMGILRSAHP